VAERVRISNPEKVLYPDTGFTKADVVSYYRAVAPVLVPHLTGRALTMRRYPDGVEGQSFFEKRCPSHAPAWMQTVPVQRSSRSDAYDACTVTDTDSLLWVANMASLELHPSLAVAGEPDRPTVMVFDLDPGAPAAMAECAEVGLALRDVLGGLGLQAWAKTSGSKGLQVYVPLNTPEVDFETTKLLSHSIGLLLEKQRPKLVVTTMAKTARPGKVLIDWSQNDRAKTTVSVYSLRARPRPTVSTPVTWEEVASVVDGGTLVFEADDVLARIERDGDLFSPVLERVQALPARVLQLVSGGAP